MSSKTIIGDEKLSEKVDEVLAHAYRGSHHIPAKIYNHGHFQEINVSDGLSTHDFDLLTRLVLACHHYCLRMEICASGPRLLKLRFHNRAGRTGRMWERHPTIEEAIESGNLKEAPL